MRRRQCCVGFSGIAGALRGAVSRPASPLLLPDYARPMADYLPERARQGLAAQRVKLT